jgi:predicted oxidoreductase
VGFWTLLQSAMTTRLVTNQIEMSLMAHAPYERRPGLPAEPHAADGLVARWPVGQLLAAARRRCAPSCASWGAAGWTDWSAVAVAWLLHHPARILPVMGTNSLAGSPRLVDALRVPMDRQTWFELYTLPLGREVA